MRLAPIPILFKNHPRLAIELAQDSSMTTHGARTCRDGMALKLIDDASLIYPSRIQTTLLVAWIDRSAFPQRVDMRRP